MVNLIPDKDIIYSDFSKIAYTKFKELNYGIAPCSSIDNIQLLYFKRKLVDWQEEVGIDNICNTSIRVVTSLPLTVNENSISCSTKVEIDYPQGNENLVDIQTNGCITRVNINASGSDTTTCSTIETLIAGQFVNLYSDMGILNCRLADASNLSKIAQGFVLNNYIAGANNVIVYLLGFKNTILTGLNIGSEYWLSDTVPGGVVLLNSIPTITNHFLQLLGVGTSTTSMDTYGGSQNIIIL